MDDDTTIEGHRVGDIRQMLQYIETANLLLVWKHTESDRLRQIVGEEMMRRDKDFLAKRERCERYERGDETPREDEWPDFLEFVTGRKWREDT